jgi:NAD(P)-dependent dehydrogenase (short-subunit alcohol dehydrogenase family)
MVHQLLNGDNMILITGASKGVGRFLYKELKKNGFDVIGTYNSTFDKDVETDPNYFKVDISNYNSVENWLTSIRETLKEVVLINCAGISYNSFAHKSDIELWKNVIDTNITGTFNVIRNILPFMREQNYGRIINFGSVVCQLPTPGISAYAASKAALNGLTKVLAVENASKGITVNSINLGYVSVGMGVEQVPLVYQEKMKNQIPAGRFCEPIEIYNTILYLINTEYVNGSILDINGGIV